MERLEDCITFLLGKAAQQVTRRARDLLAPFGVTPVQYAVLKLLWEEDGQSGAALGARLMLDSATVTGILDRLEAAGLVARRSDPGGDRRVNRVFLTPTGASLQGPLDAVMDDLNRAVAETLGRQAPGFWDRLRLLGEVKR